MHYRMEIYVYMDSSCHISWSDVKFFILCASAVIWYIEIKLEKK